LNVSIYDFNPVAEIAWLRSLPLADGVIDAVLGGNAERLLAL